ncbi:MAG: alpha/beta fold hydrolase, partial [Candidatus Hermodarchaeota archaeon]
LGIEYESRIVHTRFGKTHIIISGPKDALPLISLHGGNSITPYELKGILPLLKKFRVFAIDTIGHPGRSSETRISSEDNSYGKWLVDVLDELELNQGAFLCGSYSASFVLRLATIAPERISKTFMYAPSGFVNGSSRDMIFKLLIPWLKYRLRPSREQLKKTLKSFIYEFDDGILDLVEANFKHVKIITGMPRPVTKAELKDYTAPTSIIAAKQDILFPGELVVRRAKEIIPNLVTAECIEGPHTPTNQMREYINEKAIIFFSNN